MNYIKIVPRVGITYIPKDGILCDKCIYVAICPYEYDCRAVDDLKEYNAETNEE